MRCVPQWLVHTSVRTGVSSLSPTAAKVPLRVRAATVQVKRAHLSSTHRKRSKLAHTGHENRRGKGLHGRTDGDRTQQFTLTRARGNHSSPTYTLDKTRP
jgi:hypothetical protein